MKVHALRLAFAPQITFRFRLLDSNTWFDGLVEELSEESISFLADLPLEIGAELEVALPVAALAQNGIELASLYVRVVRRVLARWPDLRTAVTAEFCAPGARLAGAA